jgi:hypothetical protein
MLKPGLTRRGVLSSTVLASAGYSADGISAMNGEPGVHEGVNMRPQVLFLDVNETLLNLD